jgi:hypothetical protein
MPGLDPGIHAISSQQVSANGMDCRVKPGNDEESAASRPARVSSDEWREG